MITRKYLVLPLLLIVCSAEAGGKAKLNLTPEQQARRKELLEKAKVARERREALHEARKDLQAKGGNGRSKTMIITDPDGFLEARRSGLENYNMVIYRK